MVHAKTVREFREGKIKDINSVLIDSDNVYKNFHKGDRWAMKDLEEHFQTKKIDEILLKIVSTGAPQITTEELTEDIKEKKREIIGYFAKHFVDPKTNNAVPITRIESAFDNIKAIQIDPKRSAADQAQDLLRKVLDTGLALKKKEMLMKVFVPHQHVNSVQGILHKWCTVYGQEFMEKGATFGELSNTKKKKRKLIL